MRIFCCQSSRSKEELFLSPWTVFKGLRKAGIRVKGNERILGDSDFVKNVLKSAEEEFEQKYDLKAKGYDFDRVARRVAEVMIIDIDQVMAFGESPQIVTARSLLCFWAHRKLGMTTIEIGRRLNISQSAVSRSTMRGQKIARENQSKKRRKKLCRVFHETICSRPCMPKL